MNYTIETQDLTKSYKRQKVVSNLNIKIPQGSIFALLGANGAGKSTAIKMIMNIIRPTSGSADILGVDASKIGVKELQQIGYVSENQQILDYMTVGSYLDYCQSMYPNWDKEFCARLVDQFDLPLKMKIGALSRGMRMKMVLVSAVAFRPKLLVLDEPFSGLDPLVRKEFINGVLELTENQEWTILISSHDIHEIERIADWVGIIDDGELKFVQETESLLTSTRKISITLEEPLETMPNVHKDCVLFEHQQRSVQFVDLAYEEGISDSKYKMLFPKANVIKADTLSLHEVFIILAKVYKLQQTQESV